MSTPSWKWLSRSNVRREVPGRAASGGASARPCLPAVEALGDRILLSVAVPAASSDGPPPADQILIGLLKGELKLAAGEIAALQQVGGADPQLVHKLTEAFLKVNDVIQKAGEATIKGESLDSKHKDLVEFLDSEFLKIDSALAGLPQGSEAVKAAIDGIKLSAGDLLTGLSNVKLDTLDSKEQQQFLKITDAFFKYDDAFLKIEEDVLARKAGKGQQEFLIIKMNEVLISSVQKLSDDGLKEQLTGLVAQTEKILIGLLQPGETGGDVIG
jgi:hypothetical protein